MSFTKTAIAWFRRFKIIDAIIFKTYLFTVAIILAKLIPETLNLNIWTYIITLIIWFSIVLSSIFKKKLKTKTWMDNYRQLPIWKIWIYKISIIIAGLLTVKLIQEILLLNIVGMLL